jgi:hypothetical protein
MTSKMTEAAIKSYMGPKMTHAFGVEDPYYTVVVSNS